MMHIKHKKNLYFFVICFGVILIVNIFSYNKKQNEDLKYCKEYVAGTGNIKGNVDKERFEDISNGFAIGANKVGNAVFKNPEIAMQELKRKYSSGIELIKKEFDLEILSNSTIEEYKEFGDQVTTGSDEERKEAAFVSEFLDIYENSFDN